MHARVPVVTTAALLGGTVLMFPGRHAELGSPGTVPVIVSHRGASGYAPENTLAAADKAAELGFDWVETDVQRTRDGELVVLHDDTLERTTDVERVHPGRAPWKVEDFTAAEVALLDAGSWFGPSYAGARVPALRQFVDRVSRNHQKLLLEIKNPELHPGIERQTLKLLSNEGWLDPAHVDGGLIIQSFSADSVRTVHDLHPGVKTALLGTPSFGDLAECARFADQINPAYASLSVGYIAAVRALRGPHGRPLEIFTWTVDDADDARRAAGYGVDGIITNTPDVIRRALPQRLPRG
ncbi:glycerophosphodiester phosphodiesterase [Streptomyces sp. NPDC127072]|uniref:glycerophosphodiester phosphodiesterase n=1 Tax=Streptomyces sp. NPDC127072 TaxID=3347129 RepID=UPI003655E64E